MAIKEHLKILKDGKETWNEWRKKNPNIVPDLSKIDLSNIKLNFNDIDCKNKFEVLIKNEMAKNKNMDKFDAILSVTKSVGYNLRGANLSNSNFHGARLIGNDFSRANLKGANFEKADLSWTNLGRIQGFETNFTSAIIDDANIASSEIREALFNKASIKRSNLQGAILTSSNLWDVKLQGTILMSANLDDVYMCQADLRKATLWSASLQNADMSWVDLRGADLRSANLDSVNTYSIKYNRRSLFRGIRVSTTFGSPQFKRFAQDQDFIEEFRSSKLRFPLYLVWLIFADCGRSLALWASWSVMAAFLFAIKYFSLGSSSFALTHLKWDFGSVLYYSVVTFTTLGFGDIVPKDPIAAKWVMAEVVIGYFMLGGLISILATKLARRS